MRVAEECRIGYDQKHMFYNDYMVMVMVMVMPMVMAMHGDVSRDSESV